MLACCRLPQQPRGFRQLKGQYHIFVIGHAIESFKALVRDGLNCFEIFIAKLIIDSWILLQVFCLDLGRQIFASLVMQFSALIAVVEAAIGASRRSAWMHGRCVKPVLAGWLASWRSRGSRFRGVILHHDFFQDTKSGHSKELHAEH